ncbi:Putative flavonol synthase [Rhodosporidiobolus nylandii]
MPSSTLDIPTYRRPEPTKEALDYAQLARIDLGKWPQEKEQLVRELKEVVQNDGFWFVEDYGISDEEVLRQLAIGDAFLNLPLEEKRKHPCDFKNGNFFGFREGFRLMGNSGVKDNSEALCLPKITPSLAHEFPGFDFLQPFKPEIEAFQRKVHANVLDPLLRLFALMLELPEDFFAAPHAWERPSEDHLRYMRYIPNTAEVDKRLEDKQYLNAHSLQILLPDGTYKHVPYIPGSIVVNSADILSFATGGYIKSTIHRVIRPPEDQAHVPRHGLFYFSRAAHDWPTNLIAPSPLLERLGIYHEETEEKKKWEQKIVTGLDFCRARVKHSWDRPVYGDEEFRKGFKMDGLPEVKTHYP